MKKSSRFEEFVTVNGNKVKNPTWVGPWPKEGEEVTVGTKATKGGRVDCIYKVGPNGNYIRISPPKQKRNG